MQKFIFATISIFKGCLSGNFGRKSVIRTTDGSERLEKVNEYSTGGGILLWRDNFYPKEAKWIYGYGRLSRANTHVVDSSSSMVQKGQWWELFVTLTSATIERNYLGCFWTTYETFSLEVAPTRGMTFWMPKTEL